MRGAPKILVPLKINFLFRIVANIFKLNVITRYVVKKFQNIALKYQK